MKAVLLVTVLAAAASVFGTTSASPIIMTPGPPPRAPRPPPPKRACTSTQCPPPPPLACMVCPDGDQACPSLTCQAGPQGCFWNITMQPCPSSPPTASPPPPPPKQPPPAAKASPPPPPPVAKPPPPPKQSPPPPKQSSPPPKQSPPPPKQSPPPPKQSPPPPKQSPPPPKQSPPPPKQSPPPPKQSSPPPKQSPPPPKQSPPPPKQSPPPPKQSSPPPKQSPPPPKQSPPPPKQSPPPPKQSSPPPKQSPPPPKQSPPPPKQSPPPPKQSPPPPKQSPPPPKQSPPPPKQSPPPPRKQSPPPPRQSPPAAKPPPPSPKRSPSPPPPRAAPPPLPRARSPPPPPPPACTPSQCGEGPMVPLYCLDCPSAPGGYSCASTTCTRLTNGTCGWVVSYPSCDCPEAKCEGLPIPPRKCVDCLPGYLGGGCEVAVCRSRSPTPVGQEEGSTCAWEVDPVPPCTPGSDCPGGCGPRPLLPCVDCPPGWSGGGCPIGECVCNRFACHAWPGEERCSWQRFDVTCTPPPTGSPPPPPKRSPPPPAPKRSLPPSPPSPKRSPPPPSPPSPPPSPTLCTRLQCGPAPNYPQYCISCPYSRTNPLCTSASCELLANGTCGWTVTTPECVCPEAKCEGLPLPRQVCIDCAPGYVGGGCQVAECRYPAGSTNETCVWEVDALPPCVPAECPGMCGPQPLLPCVGCPSGFIGGGCPIGPCVCPLRGCRPAIGEQLCSWQRNEVLPCTPTSPSGAPSPPPPPPSPPSPPPSPTLCTRLQCGPAPNYTQYCISCPYSRTNPLCTSASCELLANGTCGWTVTTPECVCPEAKCEGQTKPPLLCLDCAPGFIGGGCQMAECRYPLGSTNETCVWEVDVLPPCVPAECPDMCGPEPMMPCVSCPPGWSGGGCPFGPCLCPLPGCQPALGEQFCSWQRNDPLPCTPSLTGDCPEAACASLAVPPLRCTVCRDGYTGGGCDTLDCASASGANGTCAWRVTPAPECVPACEVDECASQPPPELKCVQCVGGTQGGGCERAVCATQADGRCGWDVTPVAPCAPECVEAACADLPQLLLKCTMCLNGYTGGGCERAECVRKASNTCGWSILPNQPCSPANCTGSCGAMPAGICRTCPDGWSGGGCGPQTCVCPEPQCVSKGPPCEWVSSWPPPCVPPTTVVIASDAPTSD